MILLQSVSTSTTWHRTETQRIPQHCSHGIHHAIATKGIHQLVWEYKCKWNDAYGGDVDICCSKMLYKVFHLGYGFHRRFNKNTRDTAS